ncbi:hypothetical protein JCM19294_271 [Nonlabens tegetincola]|uniref:Uncharacterized protein n=1 Tax=Nonlabens tegetincola TaxID=323273 RepID=A0A090Q692_9FLAO|nr:hypothetical protein JCM19294_271 [Nonlabens tegetincola]
MFEQQLVYKDDKSKKQSNLYHIKQTNITTGTITTNLQIH